MNRRKSAVATQIGIVILTLMMFGLVYAALNDAVGSLSTWQTTYYPSGVFPQDITTFMLQLWHWLPLVVLFAVAILWGFRQAQKRSNPAEQVYE